MLGCASRVAQIGKCPSASTNSKLPSRLVRRTTVCARYLRKIISFDMDFLLARLPIMGPREHIAHSTLAKTEAERQEIHRRQAIREARSKRRIAKLSHDGSWLVGARGLQIVLTKGVMHE